ncbi:hypothetical protein TQ29_02935 [Actibacterium sp. EMB200-NS6]|nr:hypothetical protein TQ29_02935 [Actibacterium sp. EMB200-NS6]
MHSVWLDAGSCVVAETAELVEYVFDRLPDETHDDALELHITGDAQKRLTQALIRQFKAILHGPV